MRVVVGKAESSPSTLPIGIDAAHTLADCNSMARFVTLVAGHEDLGLFVRRPKPIVVAAEQRHRSVHAEPAYARQCPAACPDERLPQPLSYELRPEPG